MLKLFYLMIKTFLKFIFQTDTTIVISNYSISTPYIAKCKNKPTLPNTSWPCVVLFILMFGCIFYVELICDYYYYYV